MKKGSGDDSDVVPAFLFKKNDEAQIFIRTSSFLSRTLKTLLQVFIRLLQVIFQSFGHRRYFWRWGVDVHIQAT